jgi:hypothetical protein
MRKCRFPLPDWTTTAGYAPKAVFVAFRTRLEKLVELGLIEATRNFAPKVLVFA